MRYGTPRPNSNEEAEYIFQELRAERMRAELLFQSYAVDEDDWQDEPYDHAEDAAL